MLLSIIESLIRNISGRPGTWLRRVYYHFRLGKCGNRITIGEGVFFDRPGDIEIGDNVWIDRNVILIAGKLNDHGHIRITGQYDESKTGKIRIGSFSHIGIGSILQGHGGIDIGENFTSSAYCKIYSLSNDPSNCTSGTISKVNYEPPCILTQVNIEKNVWLGLNVSVVGNIIGKNSFIQSNSVVTKDIEPNSISGGYPAVKMKNRFEDRKE